MDQAVVTAIPETFTWMSSALGPSLALLNLGQNLYQAAGQQAYTRLKRSSVAGFLLFQQVCPRLVSAVPYPAWEGMLSDSLPAIVWVPECCPVLFQVPQEPPPYLSGPNSQMAGIQLPHSGDWAGRAARGPNQGQISSPTNVILALLVRLPMLCSFLLAQSVLKRPHLQKAGLVPGFPWEAHSGQELYEE